MTEVRSRMDSGIRVFLEAMDGLTDDQMLIPVDAVGWNVRDHMIHLAVWAEGIAALVRREDRWSAMGLDGEIPKDDEPDYDQLNERIRSQTQSTSPRDARSRLVTAHESVRQGLDELTDEDLNRPYGYYEYPFTSEWGESIAEYVLGNTEDHYQEHGPWMVVIAQQHG